ncbi:MAG TPA: hypothetical protein PKY88_02975 [Anaerohalosphaeraceae bacterium]|nr:hypothetical protein [Anaerohalosphaeraceae bacterium]
MKRMRGGILELFVWLACGAAAVGWTGSVYQGVYVDATESSTAAVSGQSPWNSGTGDTAGLWKLRNTFGNEMMLWEANGNTSYLGDCPMLVTTVSGLMPGFRYAVSVVYWNPSGQNIRLLAGLSSDSLSEFNTNNGSSRQTGAVDADRYEYEGLIGTAQADGAGTIRVYIDDIANTYRSWYDGLTVRALGASEPSPAHGATDVPAGQNLTLQWAMPADAANPNQPSPYVSKHYLYLRKNDPNLAGVVPLEVTVSSNPAAQSQTVFVENNAVYYWRVDESIQGSGPNDPNTVRGDVWSFRTTQTIPSFEPPYGSQPSGAAVFVGQEITLTAQAGVSPGQDNAFSYKWYKGPSGVTTNPVLNEAGHIEGATTAQLKIWVQPGDEGYYWCRATNSQGSGNFAAARIVLKKLLAHYTFDGTLNDSAGANHGTMSSPVYTAGISGQALVFDGTQPMSIGTGGYPNGTEGGGLSEGTVSFWINSSVTGAHSFIGSANAADGTMLNIHYSNANAVQLYVQNAASSQMLVQFSSPINLRNGQWHLLTFAWNSGTGQGWIYLDGRLAYTGTSTAVSGFTGWQYPLTVGAFNNGGTPASFYNGAMDDLRVYNYTLTAAEAAQLYVDFVPGATICPTAPGYDFDGDCRVDLADLAEFAVGWMDCGLIPADACRQ